MHRLHLAIGDSIVVESELDEWFFGYNKYKGIEGIFPKSYVDVLDSCLNADNLMNEFMSVLREWGHQWKQLYIVSTAVVYRILLTFIVVIE